MFCSVEDVELEEIEHAAGILLDGHPELVLVLRDLLRELPLQYGAWPNFGVHTVLDFHVFIQLLAKPKALSADFTFLVNLSTMDGTTRCFLRLLLHSLSCRTSSSLLSCFLGSNSSFFAGSLSFILCFFLASFFFSFTITL